MTAQLSLAGVAASVCTDRLFFAVFPPAELAEDIHARAVQWCRRHEWRGQHVAAARLHVTLQHVDDYAGLPPDVVRAAIRAGDALQAEAAELSFDELARFGDSVRKPLLVLRGRDGIPGAVKLQQQLLPALRRQLPSLAIPATYTPHMTLFYPEAGQTERLAEPQSISAVRWRAEELVLVHSLLGQTKHIPLARWKLKS